MFAFVMLNLVFHYWTSL